MMVLVSYDVSTIDEEGPGRLRRVAKICKNYGQRVQYSVFECIVDPAQWTVLKQKLTDQIETGTDSLRFYFLGANWKNRIEHVGLEKSFDQEGPLIV
ncbi:CRISPR-associated endonuclease Cas2 [Desulfosarcina ovata]|uniref:CRISPR-associated endoribonuclease Cas2 n=2 Tax=Desulfosarcina ovata TaxID=83564 RepID=A0A5K8A4Q3_9BACT|nr:CRISPR-associated endonuclease Cas2 [Desulfosarcina ovata]BBO79968.1 CRISPR-associated endoribonuclease Cas2 [Desulfosarcina ovata subsp. sediminis]BBO87270.1 CRISPR-associated endoribonuclease Cas2 [Desulfosarcina ovata subsp. ovata]